MWMMLAGAGILHGQRGAYHSFLHAYRRGRCEGVTSDRAIEMTSPDNVVSVGWRRSALEAGDKVIVTCRPFS